jgi:hypothetical protein
MSSRSGSTSEPGLGWLLRGEDVLAAVEDRRSARTSSFRGVAVVHPPALVHTLRCQFPLDVAWCSGNPGGAQPAGVVLVEVRRTARVGRRRMAAPLLRGTLVVAPAGSFERWRLRVGDRLEIRCG